MTGRSKTQKDAIETITLLLAAGTDINGADNQGRTAAHGAALWGLTDVVKFLHANGAKLDVKDKRGLTALDYARGSPAASASAAAPRSSTTTRPKRSSNSVASRERRSPPRPAAAARRPQSRTTRRTAIATN